MRRREAQKQTLDCSSDLPRSVDNPFCSCCQGLLEEESLWCYFAHRVTLGRVLASNRRAIERCLGARYGQGVHG